MISFCGCDVTWNRCCSPFLTRSLVLELTAGQMGGKANMCLRSCAGPSNTAIRQNSTEHGDQYGSPRDQGGLHKENGQHR
jgi:hypothetical protein